MALYLACLVLLVVLVLEVFLCPTCSELARRCRCLRNRRFEAGRSFPQLSPAIARWDNSIIRSLGIRFSSWEHLSGHRM
jgi:hypothetical protein